MARLGDIVKIEASSKSVVSDKFWLLNLDMVEQQTGNVIAYNYVDRDALNGSIIQFDTDCVLYSKLRPNLNKVVIPMQDGCATSEMLPLRPNTKVLTREYLTVFLRSDSFVTWAVSKTAGAKMPRLGSKELLGKEIPLPSISEQTHIAGQFAKVDELIALRKEQLAKLDQLVKSRFIELFGEPLTLLNCGKTIPLEKVFSEITVGFVGEAASSYVKIGVPYLRTQNVRKGYIDFSGLIYVSEEFHNTNQKSQIKPGDIVVSRVGVNRGMAAVIPQALEDANIANCLIIKKEATVNSNYLAYYLNISYGLSPKFGASVGSAQGVINTAILKKWEVFLPPYAQQEQFAAFVEQTDKSKLAIQQSLDKLELLKKALMQEYFG